MQAVITPIHRCSKALPNITVQQMVPPPQRCVEGRGREHSVVLRHCPCSLTAGCQPVPQAWLQAVPGCAQGGILHTPCKIKASSSGTTACSQPVLLRPTQRMLSHRSSFFSGKRSVKGDGLGWSPPGTVGLAGWHPAPQSFGPSRLSLSMQCTLSTTSPAGPPTCTV